MIAQARAQLPQPGWINATDDPRDFRRIRCIKEPTQIREFIRNKLPREVLGRGLTWVHSRYCERKNVEI